MIWVAILALAAVAFATAAFGLRMERPVWTLFAAALVFGLAGYASFGSPDLSGSPTEATQTQAEGEGQLIDSRRSLFGETTQPSRFVTVSDAFARRGQFRDAAQFLQNAVRENPNDEEAWVALGSALVGHAEGHLTPAAVEAFDRARDVAPDSPIPDYYEGVAALQTGDAGRAQVLWTRALANTDEDAEWRPQLEDQVARLEALLRLGAPERTR